MSREHLKRPHLSGTVGKTDGGRRDPSRRKHKHLFCCLGVCGDSCKSERERELGEWAKAVQRFIAEWERFLSLTLSLAINFMFIFYGCAQISQYLLPSLSLSLYLYFTLSRSSLSLSASSEDVDTFPSKIDNDRRVWEAANKQSGKCRRKNYRWEICC